MDRYHRAAGWPDWNHLQAVPTRDSAACNSCPLRRLPGQSTGSGMDGVFNVRGSYFQIDISDAAQQQPVLRVEPR